MDPIRHTLLRHILPLALLAALLTGCGQIDFRWEASAPEATLPGLPSIAEPTQPGPLDMESDSETIRLRMLNSYTYWNTLWVDVLEHDYRTGNGVAAVDTRIQIWLQPLDGKFRVQTGSPTDSGPSWLRAGDGQLIRILRLDTGETTTEPGDTLSSAGFVPPQTLSDSITPHPFEGTLGDPIAAMLVPAGLAQRMGSFHTIGVDTIAGRSVLQTDFLRDGARTDSFWLDIETGMPLRWINYGKPVGGLPAVEYEVRLIQYNSPFDPSVFVPAAGQVLSYAADVTGRPENPTDPAAATTTIPSQAPNFGTLYVVANGPDRTNLRLLRVPGACALGYYECPAPELVAGYPNADSAPYPLAWSPSGERAAMLKEAGLKTRLYLFSPGMADLQAWSLATEYAPYNMQDPAWSEDGKWLAVVGRLNGTREVILVSADTGEMRGISSKYFSEPSSEIGGIAWFHGQVAVEIFRSAESGVWLLSPSGSAPTRMAAFEGRFRLPTISAAAGAIAVFLESESDSHVQLRLTRTELDGSAPAVLASFVDAAGVQLHWSADGRMLVFAINQNTSGGGFDTVLYSVKEDGTGLQEAARLTGFRRFIFTPDPEVILVETGGGASARIFLVQLGFAKQRPVTIPGLPEGTDLSNASWRFPLP